MFWARTTRRWRTTRLFALVASLLLLIVLVVLNIVGLGVGKWVNNLGGIGTGIAAATLIGLGLVIWLRFGTTVSAADFRIPANPRFVLNSFGVICFGLVGLELASVMGDEIQDPQRTLPGAVAWGGVLSGLLYIGATLTLLIAVSKDQISVLQGIVQAVGTWRTRVGAGWIVAPFALLLSFSIAGIGSAWLGVRRVFPLSPVSIRTCRRGWRRCIPRYATPYAALIVHAAVSMVLIVMNFVGAGVQETFQKMLSLAVVLQLIPFLYMFAALIKLALNTCAGPGHYSKTTLMLAGISGLVTTTLGIVLVFFPAQQISSLWSYEVWMFGGTLFFIGLAAFFFYVYGSRKGKKCGRGRHARAAERSSAIDLTQQEASCPAE